MQIQIESPHFEPDDKLIVLVREKMEHLGKRFERITHCDVVVRKEKNDEQNYYFLEAKLQVPKRNMLFASERDETAEGALDKVVHDLEHQLRRYKEELEGT